MRSIAGTLGLLALAVTASGAIPVGYTPPRLRGGAAPANQINATGAGEVLLQVQLSESGAISNVVPLRVTPPFTEPLIASVRQWTFAPAIQDMQPEAGEVPKTLARVLVKSNVLVAGVFRPPVLVGGTIGQGPSDVGAPSPDVAFPVSTVTPPYPPTARIDAMVLVEAHVTAAGVVDATRVVQSTPGFDAAAVDAMTRWSFRPARVGGVPTDTYVYVAFGFRAPVVNGTPAVSGSPSF